MPHNGHRSEAEEKLGQLVGIGRLLSSPVAWFTALRVPHGNLFFLMSHPSPVTAQLPTGELRFRVCEAALETAQPVTPLWHREVLVPNRDVMSQRGEEQPWDM